MNFKEACELAKQLPGSMIRRTDSGDFAVLDSDGSSLNPSEQFDSAPRKSANCESQDTTIQELQAKLEATQSELQHFRSSYERAAQEVSYQATQTHSLAERLREQSAKCDDLKNQCTRLHKQYNELSEKHRICSKEKIQFQKKLDSISESEWKQINARHRKEREEHAKEMRGKRVTMRCPCSGEVENCVRCYGSGEYIVDGYGNPV